MSKSLRVEEPILAAECKLFARESLVREGDLHGCRPFGAEMSGELFLDKGLICDTGTKLLESWICRKEASGIEGCNARKDERHRRPMSQNAQG